MANNHIKSSGDSARNTPLTPQPKVPFTENNDRYEAEKLKSWYHNTGSGLKKSKQEKSIVDWLQVFIPCVGWLRHYHVRSMLPWDLLAGLSVAIMVVPQAASYADLAGVPAQIGLYGAFLPVITYSLIGSSRQLAVGPVAVTSLMIKEGITKILPESEAIDDANDPGSPELEDVQRHYNHLTTQLAFLVACIYTAVGVFRLGFLTKFLSHSVISGFTTGASITIALSQLKAITGVSFKAQTALKIVIEWCKAADEFVWQEFIMSIFLIAILFTLKHLSQKYPNKCKFMRPIGPFTVCLIGIIVVYIFNVREKKQISLVGEVKKGLPPFTVKYWFPMPKFSRLITLAVQVALVDVLESMSIATALAMKNGYLLSTNREIVGMGIANFVGAAFSSYTTTGSFSRSSVNNAVGAKSGLACFTTGVLVMMALLFLMPIFKVVPKNVLGAIVVASVVGLMDFKEAVFLFKVSKKDWLVWMASCVGTVLLGVEIGLAIAISIALLIVIAESAFPHVAELGRVPGTEVYRNVKQYQDAERTDGMVQMRVDAPIYFANVQVVRNSIAKYLHRAEQKHYSKGPIKYFILDFSPVGYLDAAGIHLLVDVQDDLAKKGISLVIVNPNAKVVRQMQTANLHEKIGRDKFFVKMHDAVRFLKLSGDYTSEAALGSIADVPHNFSQVASHAMQNEQAKSEQGDVVPVNAIDTEYGGRRNGKRT